MNKLPSFKLLLPDVFIFKSSSLKDKTILFFPKTMTSECSIEVEEFQIYLTGFKKIRFTIIGCSKDSINKNIKFAEKYYLKYLLGSDLDNACEN